MCRFIALFMWNYVIVKCTENLSYWLQITSSLRISNEAAFFFLFFCLVYLYETFMFFSCTARPLLIFMHNFSVFPCVCYHHCMAFSTPLASERTILHFTHFGWAQLSLVACPEIWTFYEELYWVLSISATRTKSKMRETFLFGIPYRSETSQAVRKVLSEFCTHFLSDE